MGIIAELEKLERANSPRKRLLELPLARPYVHSGILPPPESKTDRAVAVARYRRAKEFFFDYDVDPSHNLSPQDLERQKSQVLSKLMEHVPKDFREYRIENTKDGFHVIGKMRNEREHDKFFLKYLKLFPDSDYLTTPTRDETLRVSPKISYDSGKIISPMPTALVNTLKPSRKKVVTKLYYTHD